MVVEQVHKGYHHGLAVGRESSPDGWLYHIGKAVGHHKRCCLFIELLADKPLTVDLRVTMHEGLSNQVVVISNQF